MNSDLQDLYQDILLDHNRRPHNHRPMPWATQSVEGHNPLCGDEVQLYLKLDGNRIADISFQGHGCAISMASASMLTERIKGKTLREADDLFAAVHALLTVEQAQVDSDTLGELEALAGVRKYPMRVKCATLSWHALKAALEGEPAKPVTTE